MKTNMVIGGNGKKSKKGNWTKLCDFMKALKNKLRDDWVFVIVTVVPQKLYYYRQQNQSTTHTKNAVHHYDRIEIEKRFLIFVKDKQMFERYHDIIEYLFIEVFTLNSYSVFIRHFDRPQIDRLNYVKDILKREFPHWRKNKFYKEEFPIKKKIIMNLIMVLKAKWYIHLRKYI